MLLAVVVTGCSMEAVIWGPDGARVIQTTEELIAELSAGGSAPHTCPDASVDFGEPRQWTGRSAGEREGFAAAVWPDHAALDPDWTINLEGMPNGAVPGDSHPGYVFYRETDDGLCVDSVGWETLIAVG